jgi:hypothetical protein
MGLDITAYSNLKHLGRHVKDPALNEGESGGVDDWCYYDNHVSAFAYDSFPQSFRGLPVVGERTGADYRFIDAGCFEVTDATETHAFRAGSYSGYSRWRQNLQDQFNPDRAPGGPFFELIWFADNEGSIGPDAARDLLADFREHEARYQPFYEQGDTYGDWVRACDLAASGGLIHFH